MPDFYGLWKSIVPSPPKAMVTPKFIDDLISCPRTSPACKLSLGAKKKNTFFTKYTTCIRKYI
jgi:hypothetical protein